MVIIIETRIGGSRAKDITDTLPFDGAITTDTIGYAGGLWLLWKSDEVEVTQLAKTEQEIHVVIKCGGNPVNMSRALLFKDCLDSCGMLDMGFHGARYTWVNKQDEGFFIQERLDRAFANCVWSNLYPEATVRHLTRIHSDHCPILLSLENTPELQLPRPFRFQPMWMSHPLFEKLLSDNWTDQQELEANMQNFTEAVKRWNKEIFGNIFQRKARIEARLKGIQKALAYGPSRFLIRLDKQLSEEYWEVSQQEKEFWSVKSRYNWLIQGDRNTAFFHMSTLVRRKRNKISCLKDRMGNLVHRKEEIAELLREGFSALFETSQCLAQRAPWDIPSWHSCVMEDEREVLEEGVTSKEVEISL
ncbi:uncharacterized protein LOC115957080 [Quercus lobata]|uniref:uncharacterized protein LOC115957080 n=1 Tax=Quercus lobata TaxID=97700 RepID=UPI0012442E8E|nr:uncharacterized protein LOC115957080 [Quercus lobata]